MKINYRKVIDHSLLLTVILVLLNTGVRAQLPKTALSWYLPQGYQ